MTMPEILRQAYADSERLMGSHDMVPKEYRKQCNSCGRVKSAADFSLSKNTKDGLDKSCKGCKMAYQRKWRRSDSEVKDVY